MNAPTNLRWLRTGFTALDVGLLVLLTSIYIFLVGSFTNAQPPTFQELEQEVWRSWALQITAPNGLNMLDLLDQPNENQSTAQQLLSALGSTFADEGRRFTLPTEVFLFGLFRAEDRQEFALWVHPEGEKKTEREALANFLRLLPLAQLSVYHDKEFAGRGEELWNRLILPLDTPTGSRRGWFVVYYNFYGKTGYERVGAQQGMQSLSVLHRSLAQHNYVIWLLIILGVFVLLAIWFYIEQVRQRIARLRSQQLAMGLARQMCHELRNGLWAFSMETQTLAQLFRQVEEFGRVFPECLQNASERAKLEPRTFQRLQEVLSRELSERQVDPEVDLMPTKRLAQHSLEQIQSFARYLNLTVEQLDRNLLGSDWLWQPQPQPASAAWQEARALLQMRFTAHGIQVKEIIPDPEPLVVADRRALVHVFINLAKNAIEAMADEKDKKVLQFAVRPVDHGVVCQVHNQGPAIPAEVLPHLFRPGFSTKGAGQRGTGLTLVQETVQRLGGTVSVQSDANSGTSFIIHLPALPIDESEKNSPEA